MIAVDSSSDQAVREPAVVTVSALIYVPSVVCVEWHVLEADRSVPRPVLKAAPGRVSVKVGCEDEIQPEWLTAAQEAAAVLAADPAADVSYLATHRYVGDVSNRRLEPAGPNERLKP